MSIYTKHTTIVGAANAHIDELIDYGLATEADKSPTIEGVIGNLVRIYSEKFNVTLDDEYGHTAADQMAALLEVVKAKADGGDSPSGGVAIVPKDVNFRDFDGTILHSYTAEEFAALTAMPENPDHSDNEVPLTSQGWNWTLADAQQYVANNGKLEIGQMYAPTDGKMHIMAYIDENLETGSEYLDVGLCFGQTEENGVAVDWGDNTTPQVIGAAETMIHGHTYAVGGNYHITLEATNGSLVLEGDVSQGIGIQGNTYALVIQRVYIPNSASIGENAFYSCYNLTNVTIPNNAVKISNYAFGGCYNLTNVIIPSGVTSIDDNAFDSCCSMTSVAMPNSVTSIRDYAFQYCYKLAFITIPTSVTSIGLTPFELCCWIPSLWNN